MGDNQNARLAQAIGRLLNQKDRSTLSTVLEDIFPVYVLDDLSAPENGYQQSRDWWSFRELVTGAAGDNAGVMFAGSPGGSLIVVENIFCWGVVAQAVEMTTGTAFAGTVGAASAFWTDERNGTAGPPSLVAYKTTTAGAPTTLTVPLPANTLVRLPVGPLILGARQAPSVLWRLRASVNAAALGVYMNGYERAWEPSDA